MLNTINDIGVTIVGLSIVIYYLYQFNLRLLTMTAFESKGYVKGPIDLSNPRYDNVKNLDRTHFNISPINICRDITIIALGIFGYVTKGATYWIIYCVAVSVLLVYDLLLIHYLYTIKRDYNLTFHMTNIRYGAHEKLRQYYFYEMIFWFLVVGVLFGIRYLEPVVI